MPDEPVTAAASRPAVGPQHPSGGHRGQSMGPTKAPDPPHSLDLERSVLAVLLAGRHATAIHTVREVVRHPLVFFDRDHQLIYQACLDLDDNGDRIDLSAVVEHLRQSDFHVSVERLRQQLQLQDVNELDGMGTGRLRGLYRFRPEDRAANPADSTLESIGGYALLGEITGSYASIAGLRQNAGLLWDYYLKRRFIGSMTRLVDKSFRTTDDFDVIIDRASESILGLSRLGNSTTVHELNDVVDEALDELNKKHTNPEYGVQTGFESLDEKFGSFRPGGLYVLAARPGVGKTSFALSMLQNILKDEADQHVLFFSLEVSRIDLVNKLLSGFANIDFRRIEQGRLSPEEWEVLSSVAEDMKGMDLGMMDVADLTVQGLRSVAKRHQIEKGDRFRLLVLDYLQLLNSPRPGLSEYEKITEISRTLKILAMEMKIPIIAISQMSRESERTGVKPREPRLSDLRGSGSIEQDADAVIFLHRMDELDDEDNAETGRDVKVVIAKNRFGPTGSVQMKFFPARQRFVPVARDDSIITQIAEGSPIDRDGRFQAVPDDREDLFNGPS